MEQPTVCAVMLTKDRPEMSNRAYWCFESQTEAQRLLILDTGEKQFFPDHCREVISRTRAVYAPELRDRSIGWLRNYANQLAVEYCKPDVLMHLDSDDWSGPHRITEQVALLQSSGKDCVGYKDMLFWREADQQAWLYTNSDPRYCLGTSLCYWRRTWERNPFKDRNIAEDREFLREIDSLGVSIFGAPISLPPAVCPPEHDGYEPRMIASIHGKNTSSCVVPDSPNWKRVPGFDNVCRERMAF